MVFLDSFPVTIDLVVRKQHEQEIAQDIAFQRAEAARIEAEKAQEAMAAAEVRSKSLPSFLCAAPYIPRIRQRTLRRLLTLLRSSGYKRCCLGDTLML